MLSDQQDTFPSVIGTLVAADDTPSPIIVRLLGGIELFKHGQAIAIRSGGKTELLLCHLGVNYRRRTARETLLEAIWPESDRSLAGQSLSSLVYSLNRQLSDALDGAPAIISGDGYYRLNLEAGIWLDLERFETLSSAVDDYERIDDKAAAINAWRQAIELYHGDLALGSTIQLLVERERIRSRYMLLLARMADDYYTRADYTIALHYTNRLLACDPCREDAHRLAMRCHLRCGERAQALRQYRLCTEILRAEFDTTPEPATIDLFNQIRLDPLSV
jgi:DNA-binding SARP family transcriptional activator